MVPFWKKFVIELYGTILEKMLVIEFSLRMVEDGGWGGGGMGGGGVVAEMRFL